MTPHARVAPDARDVDHIVCLHDVSWDDYERIMEVRGDHSAPRMAYLEGELEIMSPSHSHETIKSFIGCLVETFCLENEIEFSPVGSWTLKKRAKKRGAEPDECYVFGEVKNPTRPHLAIEVEWTSGRIDKLDIYRKLGVRELWYYRDCRITPYVLRGEKYRHVPRSKALPGIDLEEVASLLDRPTASRAIRDYQRILRRKRNRR